MSTILDTKIEKDLYVDDVEVTRDIELELGEIDTYYIDDVVGIDEFGAYVLEDGVRAILDANRAQRDCDELMALLDDKANNEREVA